MNLAAADINLVKEKSLEILPLLKEHFQIKLNGIESPGFAVYKKGCGFKPHIEVAGYADENVQAEARKVSSVVFLNQETEVLEQNSYCGGNLTFYGLMKNKAFEQFGLPLTGEAGMMGAFLPNILHEVMPVTAGERFVIANWYI